VRQVTYALRTRAPVSSIATIPLDLHVLGLSLAFILSQDQTLHCKKNFKYLYKFVCFDSGRFTLFFPFALIQYFQRSYLSFFVVQTLSFEAAAKVRSFFYPPNVF
jgi:hypothetical protein